MRIDAHQHFWKYHPSTHSWINEKMVKIRQDFLPVDLEPILIKNKIDGCIAVQAQQNEEETKFLLHLAYLNPFIKGVVGWVNLLSEDLEQKLIEYSSQPKLKGFRHSLQDEADTTFILQPKFQRGLRLLHKYNFTYDLLIKPNQFNATIKAVNSYNEIPMVLDHLAKPNIQSGEVKQWKEDIFSLAKHDSVMCKISGMVTEADWHKWKYEDLLRYMEIVLEAFGPNRLMFGSDWPVCLLAAEYKNVINIVERFIEKLTSDEQNKIMGGNAEKFYNIKK